MPESPDHDIVDAPAASTGTRVQHLTYKTDAATIAKMMEVQQQWDEARRQRRLDQIYAGRRIQRERYERALRPVVVEYPEPTGNALQDFYDRNQAELRAHDRQQINAGIRYRYEHNVPW